MSRHTVNHVKNTPRRPALGPVGQVKHAPARDLISGATWAGAG